MTDSSSGKNSVCNLGFCTVFLTFVDQLVSLSVACSRIWTASSRDSCLALEQRKRQSLRRSVWEVGNKEKQAEIQNKFSVYLCLWVYLWISSKLQALQNCPFRTESQPVLLTFSRRGALQGRVDKIQNGNSFFCLYIYLQSRESAETSGVGGITDFFT